MIVPFAVQYCTDFTESFPKCTVRNHPVQAEPLGSGLSLHWSISPFDTVSFQVRDSSSSRFVVYLPL